MKRYNMRDVTPYVTVHPDGEWIRYSDHVEAMKRIAGDSAQAEPVASPASSVNEPVGYIIPSLIEALARDSSIVMWPKRMGQATMPLYAAPAPSASVQYAKREDAPYAPLPVPSASPAALTDDHPIIGVLKKAMGLLALSGNTSDAEALGKEARAIIAAARQMAESPAALTNEQRRSGFSCANRAADPQSEFAACRQWCGDSQRCLTGFDTAKFFRHVDTILSMDMEQREQSTFSGSEATRELLAAIRVVRKMEDARALLAASPAALTDFLSEDDFADLFNFNAQCEDFEADGYTLPKERMKRLAELGAVQSLGFGRYGVTSFGAWLIETKFEQNPTLPLHTIAEWHAINAAMSASKEGA